MFQTSELSNFNQFYSMSFYCKGAKVGKGMSLKNPEYTVHFIYLLFTS